MYAICMNKNLQNSQPAHSEISTPPTNKSINKNIDILDKMALLFSEIIEEFKEILVISNSSIDFRKSEKISVIKDIKKNLGPLGGVLTAMRWVKDNNKDYKWVSTFPADTPFFKHSILQKFLQDIQPEESKLFFIKSNNTRHNIFGLWSIDLMDKLEEDLNKGERKVELWANSIGVKTINIEFQNEDPFFNINTKEDLEKAKDRLKND